MFAVVSHNGNQYKLEVGKEYKIDLVESSNPEQKDIVFSDVLLVSDGDKNQIGEPLVKGVSVKAEILGVEADKKVRVFKFRAKKRYKREQGHREKYTLIKVSEIKNDK